MSKVFKAVSRIFLINSWLPLSIRMSGGQEKMEEPVRCSQGGDI